MEASRTAPFVIKKSFSLFTGMLLQKTDGAAVSRIRLVDAVDASDWVESFPDCLQAVRSVPMCRGALGRD